MTTNVSEFRDKIENKKQTKNVVGKSNYIKQREHVFSSTVNGDI